MQRLITLIKATTDNIRLTYADFAHLEDLVESEKTDKLLDVGNRDYNHFIHRHRTKQAEYITVMRNDIKRLRQFLDVLEGTLNKLEPIVEKEAENYCHE